MHDPRVLVDLQALEEGARVELDRREGRHLVRVRRKRPGDLVEVADGAGRTGGAVISTIDRDRVVLEVGEVTSHPRPEGLCVDLAVGVLHGPAMDWVVQKAVETGVRRLTPLVTTRSQGGQAVVTRRAGHWRRVADESLKQCRRPWALEITRQVAFSDLVTAPAAPPLLADPDGLLPCELELGGSVLLVVGPEGGFTDDERQAARAGGWPAVRLGPHVLRTETAATVGASVLMLEDRCRRTPHAASHRPPSSQEAPDRDP